VTYIGLDVHILGTREVAESIVFQKCLVVSGALGSLRSTKRQGHVLSTIFGTWAARMVSHVARTVHARNQINSGESTYPCVVILTYLWESVGSRLGTGLDLIPYKYKGVRLIENPQTHSNRTNHLLYLSFMS
jgi:hypothetical protein